MTNRFREIGRINASEAVREQLVSLIESGELKPGEKLPAESALARSFGVSRPVVREALGSLRAIGLIDSLNGKGSFVNSRPGRRPVLLGRFSLEELHEVRSLLEVDGATRAASRHNAEDAARLRGIVDSLEACTDHEEWVRLDAEFHVALAEATGNQVLARLVEHLRDLLVEQSQVVSAVEGRIPHANVEHRAIYEAVAAGDERRACEAMSAHLINAYRN
jgi:GntR family transcriptional repressor for pyruvate dehydrogenase complex